MLPRILDNSKKTRGKGTLQVRANREITLKRRSTEVMGVIIIMAIIILCAPSVGSITLGYVDQGQMPTTFGAKKATMRGTVP